MQWLNTVDEALDWVLGPPQQQGENANANGGDDIDADAIAAAAAQAAAAAAGASIGDGDAPTTASAVAAGFAMGRTVSNFSAGAASSTERGPVDVACRDVQRRHEDADGVVGNEGQRLVRLGENNSAATGHRETTMNSKPKPRQPPPPPPPPPVRKATAPPPPPAVAPATKKVKQPAPSPLRRSNTPSSMTISLPPDTCPSTPLMAMAGEFLVLDESPHPTAVAASSLLKPLSQEKDAGENINILDEDCKDGDSNCKPPDSIFGELTDATIKESGEAEDVMQQEFESSKIEPLVSSQTNQQTQKVLLSEHDQEKSGDIALEQQRSTTPLLISQMQDFAKASPAPTKVTIGDREEVTSNIDRSLKLPRDDHFAEQSRPKRPIPPPPPPPIQIGEAVRPHKNTKRQEPPSPSTFIIHLPTTTQTSGQQQQPPPSPLKMPHMPPPPPSPMAIPSSLGGSRQTQFTPNPIRPQTSNALRAPRSATRATPRPTPGVIRRKLREPSLSPPESPEMSFNLDSEADMNTSLIPPPPIVPVEVTTTATSPTVKDVNIEKGKAGQSAFDKDATFIKEKAGPKVTFPLVPDEITTTAAVSLNQDAEMKTDKGGPAALGKDTKVIKERADQIVTISPPPPSVPQDNDEWDDNAPNSISPKVGQVSFKDTEQHNQQPRPVKAIPPPPFQDQSTPLTHNRKSSLDEDLSVQTPALPVPPGSGDPKTPFKATNKSNVDNLEKDADLSKSHQAASASSHLNRVEKALDWVLTPVQVKHGRKDDQVKAEANAEAGNYTQTKTSQEKNEKDASAETPVAEAITDWFKRMGSTEQGEIDGKHHADEGKKNDNFLDEDSFHSQVTNDSELTESNDLDDFAIPAPTFSQVHDADLSWDPSLNRYGFFHVRLLRAQRLPCAAGSSINTTLSLQPWKGRIRIPSHVTVEGPSEETGICLRWDKPPKKQRGGGGSKGSKGGKDGDSLQDDPLSHHSMVHAYNSEDTPVPTIFLELSISSLGVFDRFLCSVSIPCHDLLRNPRGWVHRWYPASLVQSEGSAHSAIDDVGGSNDEKSPLILLETCFDPKETRATVSTLSQKVSIMDEHDDEAELDDTDQVNISGDSDTLGSIPHIIRPNDRSGLLPDDDSLSKSSTLTPALIRKTTVTKSHLPRVRSFWTPTWCAVCSKNITTIGWNMQGKSFECEACHLFFCRDCQLQVDARIPCGSELATIAVKKAQQYQVPSFSKVMTTLAPQLENSFSNKLDKEGQAGLSDSAHKQQQSEDLNLLHEGKSLDGIGIMNIRVLRACLFDKRFPSEADPEEIFKTDWNLRNGDHYVRVSWLGSKESKRTKTVLQTAKPLFDSEEMVFDVPHYGMEYKLEVLDANTDKPIGSCLLSAQGLLQWQRDDMLARKDRLLLSLFHLRRYSEPRRMKLELRTGVKDGFGLNFYNSSKGTGGPSNKGKDIVQRPGEISGWLELDVHLEEDRELFYSATPRKCPPRAEEDFDIALIQLHIARIGAIFEAIQQMISQYMYIISWKDPKVTGASMVIFVIITLRFNLEYLGALPIGSLVLYMIYLAYVRVNGNFKDRWTMKEKEALIKSETKIEKNQSIFRPLGLLQVGSLKGKNLRSRELGLPGSYYASIFYDPLRYANEKMKSSMIKVDSSSGCTHEVGATISPGITSSPVWTHMQESPELMRLKHLLPDDRLWRQEKETDDPSLAYPILQPIVDGRFSDDEGDDRQQREAVSLLPWEQSSGAVVIQVRFSDVLGSFQVFDNVLGEVVIPLAKLAGSGRAVEGWFRLLDVGSTDTIPGETPDEDTDDMKSEELGEDSEDSDDDEVVVPKPEFPELYVKVKFASNTALKGDISLEDEMESFKVICEEMSRTASIAQDQNSIGVIGSSLNTINTVRTLGGKLQNQISFAVDMLERVRNAFNFSNPRITVFILLCLTILWIVLALIPTRIVVLLGGLAQYGGTFYAKFIAVPSKKTERKDQTDEGSAPSNKGNPIENLFQSIPTDEDLRRMYFWEARRLGEKEREKFAIAKRQTRLEKLWKATWHGALELKEKKAEQPTVTSPSKPSRNWSWEPAFGLIEGHRFIWWRSEKHFDTGEAPLGQIFFAGHSGLAGLSPLDLRELSKEEIPFVVSIFGRGEQGQQKISLLAPSADAKDSLENAVLDASMDAKAD